jgi:hypothetical protein
VDSLDSAQFLRSDVDDTATSHIIFNDGLSWTAKTRYFSINSSDPQPYDDAYGYFRGNIGLGKDSGASGSQNWYAEVNLPDDAVVTEFKIWFKDSDANDLTCNLDRRPLGTSSSSSMASAASSGTPGEGSDTDTTISNEIIDNASYAYYVRIQFPSGDTYTDLMFRSARIEYTTTGP